MALIHFEHFDLYGTDINALLARGYSGPNLPVLSAAVARTGSHTLLLNQNLDRRLDWPLPAALTVVGQGCAIRYEGSPVTSAAMPGLRFGVSGTPSRVRVVANSSMGVDVYQDTTFRGASAPGILAVNTWAWLEARVTSGAGSTGAVEVRLNGTQIINLTGLTLTSSWTTVSLGQENITTNITRFDDWIVWDTTDTVNNTFFGDTFVIVAPPDADGTPNAWTTSSGSTKWSLVDEATPDDVDYLVGNAVSDVQEIDFASPTLPAGDVAAVAVQGRALKTDAGSSSIELGVASGVSGTDMSAARALGTGALVYSHITQRNPDGTVVWTQSAAQAARLRIRRAA